MPYAFKVLGSIYAALSGKERGLISRTAAGNRAYQNTRLFTLGLNTPLDLVIVFPVRRNSSEELSRKIQYNVGRLPSEIHCGLHCSLTPPRGSTEVPIKVSVLRVAEISVLEEFILYTFICNFNLL